MNPFAPPTAPAQERGSPWPYVELGLTIGLALVGFAAWLATS